ncbi:MAG TPA: FHA domain-containing protein [Rhodanobacteraceae bacterium]|nr:FHA domain-containing protein [Rhodanobacteraceae bacterium]
MRIGFVNAAREPFRSAGARVRIGCAAENDLALSGAGVAQRHLTIAEDRRGLVLEVLPGASHIYVNARPVRERALLRFGDILSVGGCKLALLPDNPADHDCGASKPLPGDAAPRPGFAALRAVSGAWSGRLLPIEGRLVLGGRGFVLAGVPQCELQLHQTGVRFDAGDAQVLVNGVRLKRALLQSGDQLILGEHRFVVEAPGLQAASAAAQETPEPPQAPIAIEPRRSIAELWWLLGTAALLAVIIAALLWWKH